jgi:myo-inositol-1(or 4)-monophosphatase
VSNLSPDHLLETAVRAAKTAGAHALFNKARRTETSAMFDHDIKLVLDMECQRIAEDVIASGFPDHGILGEEHTRSSDASDYEWIIDPIDGTVNFAQGSPLWCCSVAVRLNGEVLAGCVYAPELDLCYTAVKDQPARCNSEPIRPADKTRFDEAVIHTGLPKHMPPGDLHHFDLFCTLALRTFKVRINGSAALDICRVAAGSADGYVESGIYLWDYAAAGLIARQAGAQLVLYPDEQDPHGAAVVCASEQLIDDLNNIYTGWLQNRQPSGKT